MPVTWEQVRSGLDPEKFTVRTAPALIARSKAWQGYEEAERPIVRAIELLSKAQKGGASGKAAGRRRQATDKRRASAHSAR
jgi:hypothetical protein